MTAKTAIRKDRNWAMKTKACSKCYSKWLVELASLEFTTWINVSLIVASSQNATTKS